MGSSPFTPPDLADLVARRTRWGPGGRRQRPFRFLLDSRVFRLLCDPRQTAALDNFRASLARLRLAPEGGLPDLEMTPLAVLDVLGIEPPRVPEFPFPKSMATLRAVEVGSVVMQMIKEEFEKAPELEPASLQRRVEELRAATDPAAHDLFDLCLARVASQDKRTDEILKQLAFDALFRFRFPEEYRERMSHLFDAFLLDNKMQIPGLTKVRLLKMYWDKSLERILKKNPKARGEILAVDQELKPRTFKDFLGWEVIHFAVFGYARKVVHPVVAFAPEPEDRLSARCRVYKSALRAFLDEIPPMELTGGLRSRMEAWRPGWLVPCRVDGMLETPVSTGEIPVWVGPSLWAAPS